MDASALQRRVVIHLDLDCFYAQVEAKRLGIDGSVPLAVQQWSGLIAVNYPARHKGVKRHLNVVEAKKLVPELVCVHVETIGDDEGGADGADTAGEGDAMGEKPTEKTDGTSHDKERRKVSLRRYRRASWRVMAALADQCEHVERASIDEAYVDVTREVDAAMAEGSDSNISVEEMVRAGVASSGAVVELTPSTSEHDRRLAIGAYICAKLRDAVFQRTGFTMSGGVAHNKMLAKLASARHKPNKQTAVSHRAVTEMMESLPMRSIKGLGGKFGEKVEVMLRRVCGDGSGVGGSGRGSSYEGGFPASALSRLDPEELSAALDPKSAAWLLRVARGEDIDAVCANVREGVKSVNAFKSFQAVDASSGVHRWVRVLAGELAERLVEDRVMLRRQPRHLRLEYRAGIPKSSRSGEPTDVKSKSLGFPPTASNHLAAGAAAWSAQDDNEEDHGTVQAALEGAADAIAGTAIRAFDALGRDALPSTRVGLSATDFVPTPTDGGGIAKFFGRPGSTEAAGDGSDLGSSRFPGPAPSPTRPVERKATALDAFLATKAKTPALEQSAEALVEVPTERLDGLDQLDDGYVACEVCGERHAAGRDAQEHADYHVALDLSREMGSGPAPVHIHRTNDRPVIVNGGSGKRKRHGSGSASFKAKSMTSFFTKK